MNAFSLRRGGNLKGKGIILRKSTRNWQDKTESEDDLRIEEGLCVEIDELLLKKEMYLQKRACKNWLQNYNMNTSFLHAQASQMTKKNAI